MDVSILIVNWNTCRYLRECLQSIHGTVQGLTYEVIVVDNASRDGSQEMVRSEFPWAVLIANHENVGFAHGNNQGLARASGEYVLVMNPDVVLLEGALSGLVAFAREHRDAGVVSPKLLNPDRTLQNFYGRIPTLSTVYFVYTYLGSWMDGHLLRGRMRRRERYEEYGDFQEVLRFSDGGAGFSCTLIPRTAIERVGFMDERFPLFFNDGDFAMRLFRDGYVAYILPHVQAIHYGGSSVKQLHQVVYNQEWIYGLRMFSMKFKGFLYNRAIDLILSLNVPMEFAKGVERILKGQKPPSSLFEPILAFWKVLRYRPENARPTIFRLPGGKG